MSRKPSNYGQLLIVVSLDGHEIHMVVDQATFCCGQFCLVIALVEHQHRISAMDGPVVMPVAFGRRPVTTPDMATRYEAHYFRPATRYSDPLRDPLR